MPCYSPLTGYFSKEVNPTGKRSIVFQERQADSSEKLTLPCGQCIGCRLERSRQWAIRCVHEASLHEKNCFITLTYDKEHLPTDGSLQLDHFQKFMKRLRKQYGPKIRFFHCGEYGEKYQRPHYHACIFNHDFNDKTHFTTNNDIKLYTSESLQKLWPYGFTTLGDVTFESAAYVARYITKKITGKNALLHYTKIDAKGEILQERQPEYTTMSRRPGIGRNWFEKFKPDLYPDDFVVVRGKKMRVPRYYDNQLERDFPFEHDDIKERRKLQPKNHKEQTYERLQTKETIKLTKLNLLKRSYESNDP